MQIQNFADNWVFLIILLVGGLATLIGAIANYLRDKKRREIMTQFAEQIGLEYLPYDQSLISRLRNFQLFSIGRAKKIKNVISGDTGDVQMSIFDFQYSVGSGKNQTIHRQSVVSIESPHLFLPSFNLKPAGFFQRLGSVFGMVDVKFSLNPAFNQQQKLQGLDEEAIKDFFDDRLLRSLESNEMCIEGVSGKLIFYYPRKSFRLEELKGFMERAFEIYAKLNERVQASS